MNEADTDMEPTHNVACLDEARNFVLEHGGSHFVGENNVRDENGKAKQFDFNPGICKVCGRAGVMVVAKKGEEGNCLAQEMLVRKRYGIAPGHPVAPGSPRAVKAKKKSEFAKSANLANKGGYMLVEPDRAVFVTNVEPNVPLPPNVEATKDLQYYDILDRALVARTPFFLGMFNQKADATMALTVDSFEIVVNGTQPPVRLDRRRLLRFIDLIDEFGVDLCLAVREMRTFSRSNSARAQKIKDRLEKEHPDLIRRQNEFPSGDSVEFQLARGLVRHRASKLAGKKKRKK